jgi:hypothetical protein
VIFSHAALLLKETFLTQHDVDLDCEEKLVKFSYFILKSYCAAADKLELKGKV